MDYISTTELRTASSELIETLKKGGSVRLIYRSKIVGIIKPVEDSPKPFEVEKFKKILRGLKPKRLISRSQREKIYRKHLMQKYGKNLH